MSESDVKNRTKVLIIEDEPVSIDFLRSMLARVSDRYYFVEPARTLAEGLRMLKTRVFDVLLLDLMLPDSRGPDTVMAVRESNQAIPIVVVTGMDDDALLYSAMEEGAQDYLVKGHFNADLLAKSMQYAIYIKSIEEQARCLKDQLLHAQKMELVGRLTGGVAHDFNNLLTVINGYADMLKDTSLAGNEEARDYIGEILRAGKKAATMAKHLLVFSRGKSQTQTVDLNSLMEDMVPLVRRLIGEDIELTFEKAPSLPLVEVDAGCIEQVLVNLVVNARDAMPEGGEIAIETAVERLDGDCLTRYDTIPAGEYAVFAVRDTGCGMPEEVKQHLFEPFFTTKSVDKGTGLGLATSRGIVKNSGGYIAVESKLGEGTYIKVYLPAQGKDLKVVEVDKAVVEDKKAVDESVLVVEDDNNVRCYVVEVLERKGYRVLSASNGDEALDLARKDGGRIDLLLTDLIMPKMAGDTLLELLKNIVPDIKAIFMTGYIEAGVDKGARLELADGILEKPVSPVTLCDEARRVLDKKKASFRGSQP